MNETNLLKRIQLKLPPNARLFRNNTGMGWAGQIFRKTAESITLINYRPLHAGLCAGSSDLIGWTVIEITPEMVGKRIAVFTAVECKSPSGRISVEQKNFINAVQSSSGIAGVARSVEDAYKIMTNGRPKY